MAEGTVTDWFGLHKTNWGQDLVPEAYAHPAKVNRGLARKIYAHAIEQGWLKEGDTCLDPFAGIGGFALDALANGLNFVGVELEQNFVDMGAGCDCTGISKADWVRCFGRWKRFAHKDGWHWCPRCLAEAGQITKERKAPKPTQAQAKRRVRMRELMVQTGRKVDFSLYTPIPFPKSRKQQEVKVARLFGAKVPVTSYERNSGEIPHIRLHRYAGNLDLFARHARDGATAVLVQGDSRRLCEVLEGARAEGLISSPPFCESLGSTDMDFIRNRLTRGPSGSTKLRGAKGAQSDGQTYGTDPAQLGNMPTGEPPQAVISSPSYAKGCAHTGGDDPKPEYIEGGELRFVDYGKSDGQLAAMREGDVDAVIASPPYSKSLTGGGEAIQPRLGDVRKYPRRMTLDESYGNADGQLAALPEGEPPQVDGIIASPPFTGVVATQDPDFLTPGEQGKRIPSKSNLPSYSIDPDNLGNMKEGEPPAGIVSSPPFSPDQPCASQTQGLKDYHAFTRGDGTKRDHIMRSSGNLGTMPTGEPPQVDGIVASPPYSSSDMGGRGGEGPGAAGAPHGGKHQACGQATGVGYGSDEGNLGNMKEGEPPAGIVSSPPWENALESKDIDFIRRAAQEATNGKTRGHGSSQEYVDRMASRIVDGYGQTEDNLGNTQGDTFWSAARAILLQCHAVLAPGGVAIFVCKRFVRDKKIVEFSQQWADLCQSCGFELIEWIKAWLVEERGTQYDLEGEAHTKTVKRFSFFRRLHVQKYPHLAIEWEDVLIFRKARLEGDI